MLSGNLFSLSLGGSTAATAIFFLAAAPVGPRRAIVLTLGLGLAIVAIQGVMVGAIGANPIIVTIGAGGLSRPASRSGLSGGETWFRAARATPTALARRVGGIRSASTSSSCSR